MKKATESNNQPLSTGNDTNHQKNLFALIDRMQPVFDNMAEGIGIIDLAGRIVYINQIAQQILGVTKNEATTRTYDDPKWQNLRIDGTPLPDGEHPMAIMMATKQAVHNHEIAVQPPGGYRFYIAINATPLIDEEGSLTGGIGSFINTTSTRQSAQQIQELNERLSAINEELSASNEELYTAQQKTETERQRLTEFVMQAPAAICILSGPDLRYEFLNSAYQALMPARDFLGVPFLEALPELKGTMIGDLLFSTYRQSKSFGLNELMVPLADRTGGVLKDRYFSFRYEPRRNEKGITDGVFVFAFDVTEIVHSKQKLERAYEELSLSKQAAQLGTFDLDVKNDVLLWDERCRELFGISHKDTIDYQRDFVGGLHSEDRERILSVIDLLFTDLSLQGLYDVEYRTVGAEDGRIRWVRAKGKVFFDIHNKPERFVGMVLDITEEKRDEQRKNDFIGMVSHEMKTPLTSLSGYLQLVEAYMKQDPAKAVNLLNRANLQIDRMSKMINGFLNVSRLESGKIYIDKQRFDMAVLMKEAEEEVRHTINTHGVVFAPVKTTFVNADRDKISQVITNLISNAIKYSPANTVVNVACITENSTALVSVADKGIGIQEEDKDKIFDRYYRVAEGAATVGGFGIGLYVCAEIIQRHDGKIWVESEVGKGSTFSFCLPVMNS